MGLNTEWDDQEKTILRVTYPRGWDWDDMEANLPIEQQHLDSVNHRVDVIADFRGTNLPPGAIIRLPKIANSPPYKHPNSGIVVMVGSPFFMNEVVGVYRKLYGSSAVKLHMVSDLEKARALIVEYRASLAAEKKEIPEKEPEKKKEPPLPAAAGSAPQPATPGKAESDPQPAPPAGPKENGGGTAEPSKQE